MSDAASPQPRSNPRSVVAGLGLATLAAAGLRVWQSLGAPLWLDDLYTATLIDTSSLAHMLEGALRGVDGNPPLYLSLAWALTHLVPASPDPVLRTFNLALLAVTALLQYRIGRRIADPVSVAVGLIVLNAVDGMGLYALLEIRTYALYLTLAAATLWATLRVVDRPSAGRTVLLAALGTLLALSHSFGGFYAGATLAAAGLINLRDATRVRAFALAALPVLATTVGWVVVSLPAQLAVADPYGWIPRPALAILIQAFTGSVLLTPVLAAGLCAVALCGGGPGLRRCCAGFTARPDVATLYAVLAAYAGLTAAGWIGSQAVTPFFVSRYFIPNVSVGAMLIVPAVAAARQAVRPVLGAAALVVCVGAGLARVAYDDGGVGGILPCSDERGHFLEEGRTGEGLPVVAESPGVWFPRDRYAPGQATLYPLDWGVVLHHPSQAPNNAMDFHIMEILRGWAAPGTALASHVLTTADLLARHERFLVLDEANRGWFDELRATRRVSARLLRRGVGCRLWEVGPPRDAAAP